MSKGSSPLISLGHSITQSAKGSPVTISSSLYPHSSQSLASSSLGYPVIILSTNVEQKIHASSIHVLNSASKFQLSACFNTHSFKWIPLSSINSTGSITSPLSIAPLKCLYLSYKNLASFPGKLIGGHISSLSFSSYTIPASVVLETMYLKVSSFAYALYFSYSSCAATTSVTLVTILFCTVASPSTIPLRDTVYWDSCARKRSSVPNSMGFTSTISPSNSPFSFAMSIM